MTERHVVASEQGATQPLDGGIKEVVSVAQKAEAFEIIAMCLDEIELIESRIKKLRHSRSKTASVETIGLSAQVSEIKIIIENIVRRHKKNGL